MTENPAACIRSARQTKHYITFSDAEFEYVSSCKELSATEKLIWFNLARKAFWDPELSCHLTHQMLAKVIGSKTHTVYRALRRLKEQGFINVAFNSSLQVNTYKITLPHDGVIAIENAPIRAAKREGATNPTKKNICNALTTLPSDLHLPPNKTVATPPTNLSDILIKNNNIKIHNSHKLLKSEEQQGNSQVDCGRLLEQFELLQQEAKNMTPVERIKYVNSHFNVEEMDLISRKLSERQKIIEEIHIQYGEEKNKISKIKVASSNKLIDIDFEGENFLVEEEVKNQILSNIPVLYRTNKIKGKAALKPLNLLLKEIFFYVAKAGGQNSNSQLKKYYLARKICLKGDWEQPKGMAFIKTIDNEEQWFSEKRREIKASESFIKSLGSV